MKNDKIFLYEEIISTNDKWFTMVILRVMKKEDWKSSAIVTYSMYEESKTIYVYTTEEHALDTRMKILKMIQFST